MSKFLTFPDMTPTTESTEPRCRAHGCLCSNPDTCRFNVPTPTDDVFPVREWTVRVMDTGPYVGSAHEMRAVRKVRVTAGTCRDAVLATEGDTVGSLITRHKRYAVWLGDDIGAPVARYSVIGTAGTGYELSLDV